MTKISYGVGWLFDGERVGGGVEGDWNETEDGSTGTRAVVNDDWLDLNISAAVGNKAYYVSNATNLGLSSTVYTKIRWRFKCGNGTIKAKIIIEFSDATQQTVLAEVNSQTFTVGSATITSGKIIDHILLFANGGTGDVYYDFVKIYKDDFTLPNTAFAANYTPPPRDSDEAAPSRITDIIQGLGGESARFDCSCDLDVNTWTRAGDVVDAQVIDEISHELSSTVDFLWLDTGLGRQFKARMRDPIIHQLDKKRVLDLAFKEYSRCNASLYSYIERFGLNL